MGHPSVPAGDIFGAGNTGLVNLTVPEAKFAHVSIPPSTAWQTAGQIGGSANTLLNTGLGIYNALNPVRGPSANILNGSMTSGGLSPMGGSNSGGQGKAIQAPNNQPQLAQVSGGTQQQPTNDKHFDILRQILGVYNA